MKYLCDDYILLFKGTKHVIILDSSPFIIICDDIIIINDILIFSNHVPTIFHYFACITRVLFKYRLSFKSSKCEFFKLRVGYVDHDLIVGRNCPGSSKISFSQE